LLPKWGHFGIWVNCVTPGPVRTKLAIAAHSQAIIDAYHDTIPLICDGSEAEIAEAIVFLVSEKARYATRQTLAVDGGFDLTGVDLPALRV
jgi:meso-butanediol dehydrogenase / (S,S)-butanediol dehydrogenase / diacetyl reductase